MCVFFPPFYPALQLDKKRMKTLKNLFKFVDFSNPQARMKAYVKPLCYIPFIFTMYTPALPYMYTYVHPVYMYIHHIYTIYTPYIHHIYT